MTTPPLYALLYRSLAIHPMGELEIRALSVRSGQRNATRGITGLMLHGTLEYLPDLPGAFVQWLEGPEDEVLALYKRIARDDRHSDEEVLIQGTLAEVTGQSGRLFPQWGMGSESMGELPATAPGFLAYVRRRRQEGQGRWAQAA